jgi:phage/plasmid-like protein (TIGR03299 family)
VDPNVQFAEERAGQLQAAVTRQAAVEQRIADGKLTPIGDGRYRITDASSWDNGEIWTQRDGQLLPEHGLDTTTGQAALYTAVPAWHELGTVIDGGTSDIDTVLQAGRIGFDVVRRPVLYQPTLDSSPKTMAGKFVTVRDDTGAGLGVVGADYEVLQNSYMFEFLQDLVDRYDVVWDSAGALRDGRKVFVSMRLPDTVSIDADGINDQIVPYIAEINSHDGSSMAQIVVSPWRIRCGNTERFAVRDAVTRWGVRHTRNARDRIDEARRTLGLTVKYFDTWAAEEEALAQTDLAIDEFREVASQLWPAPEDGASKRTVANHTNRLETLTALYDSNSAQLGRTAYAGERAFTEYLDWRSTIRPSGSLRGRNLAARATAILEGGNDDKKSQAHKRLLTLVRR